MKNVICEEKNVRKQIDVTDEVRAKIRKIFGCSNPTMWRALSYHSEPQDTQVCDGERRGADAALARHGDDTLA